MHYTEQGDPAGAVVILLHGYSDSWFSFSRILPLLSPSLHVYAISQRGHGLTDQPDSGYAMPDLAADVLAFMDAQHIARAAIVGHSMGSLVAQEVTAAAPERVERLVLVGSGTGVSHVPGLPELRDAILAFNDPVPPEFVKEFQYSTVFHPVPDEFMDQAIRESLRLPARVWHAVVDGMFAMPRRTSFPAATMPTLLVWGDRDAVFPRTELDALRALVPSAWVRVYAETGHAPHWERPEQFVRDLEAFLRP
jgi:pimeloyl-ACP methyl ester carboxylesterase